MKYYELRKILLFLFIGLIIFDFFEITIAMESDEEATEAENEEGEEESSEENFGNNSNRNRNFSEDDEYNGSNGASGMSAGEFRSHVRGVIDNVLQLRQGIDSDGNGGEGWYDPRRDYSKKYGNRDNFNGYNDGRIIQNIAEGLSNASQNEDNNAKQGNNLNSSFNRNSRNRNNNSDNNENTEDYDEYEEGKGEEGKESNQYKTNSRRNYGKRKSRKNRKNKTKHSSAYSRESRKQQNSRAKEYSNKVIFTVKDIDTSGIKFNSYLSTSNSDNLGTGGYKIKSYGSKKSKRAGKSGDKTQSESYQYKIKSYSKDGKEQTEQNLSDVISSNQKYSVKRKVGGTYFSVEMNGTLLNRGTYFAHNKNCPGKKCG